MTGLFCGWIADIVGVDQKTVGKVVSEEKRKSAKTPQTEEAATQSTEGEY
jgi:hypothetical protein